MKVAEPDWLGGLPKGWSAKRLKYLSTINDETLSETTDPDLEFLYVDIGSVDANEGIQRKESMFFELAPSRARRIVRNGDTIVSTVRTYLRAVAPIEQPEKNLIVSTGFAVVRPKGVESKFLAYCLRSSCFIETVVSRSVGVSYPATNPTDVSCIKLPVPPVETQQAIANFLDAKTAEIDTLIAKKRALIYKLKEKRSALIACTVTRSLLPDSAMKASGVEWLGEVAHHWQVKPLKHVAHIGNGSTPARDNAEYWEDGVFPWLNSSVVNLAEVTEAVELVTATALRMCHLPKIQPPAVLVGITGEGRTRGMATTLKIEATINQHIAFIKPMAARAEANYLRRVMDRAYQFLRSESEGGGSTKGAITCDQIANMKVPVPPLAEQLTIAVYLDRETLRLDKLAMKVEAAIACLTEYRQALITSAVTGKIDVRQWQDDKKAA